MRDRPPSRIWPARDAHLFFETVYGLAREGRLPPRRFGDAVALLALAHAHGFMFGPLPAWMMRGLSGAAAAVAALLRIEPWTPRFAGHVPSAPPATLHLPAEPVAPGVSDFRSAARVTAELQ